MKAGYDVGNSLAGPLVSNLSVRGDHGFSPSHPEMRASFFIAGPEIRNGADLGDVDMRSVAPTIARLIGASLPDTRIPALNVTR